MIVNGLCELKILKRRLFQKYSLLISTYYSTKYIRAVLKRFKPYLFCINDVENGLEESRDGLKQLLNDLYPAPAEWELK